MATRKKPAASSERSARAKKVEMFVPGQENVENEGQEVAEHDGTPPSGQGGATPKQRKDHQDQFPPNHIPDDPGVTQVGEKK